jgi:hypothetical protein
MGYVITKQPDGDVSWGNLNGELVSLSDSVSDYATGGYAIISGETANTNNTPQLINCDLWRILTLIPVGGQGGFQPVWNPNTQKMQVYCNGSLNGPDNEVANGYDLSGYVFQFFLFGY